MNLFEEASQEVQALPVAWGLARLAWPVLATIASLMLLGASFGNAWERWEVALPLWGLQVLTGAACGLFAVPLLGRLESMPLGLLYPRLLPSASYGATVGACMYAMWWTFEWSLSTTALGGSLGLVISVPMMVSFGVAGGENRPLGGIEFFNLGAAMIIGFGLGVISYIEERDATIFPGAIGMTGILVSLLGARFTFLGWYVEGLTRSQRQAHQDHNT